MVTGWQEDFDLWQKVGRVRRQSGAFPVVFVLRGNQGEAGGSRLRVLGGKSREEEEVRVVSRLEGKAALGERATLLAPSRADETDAYNDNGFWRVTGEGDSLRAELCTFRQYLVDVVRTETWEGGEEE